MCALPSSLKLPIMPGSNPMIHQVMGNSTFVTRALPVFVGFSALGNVFAQSFAMPRVKQELAKEGILPFSRFWASDWPFNAPSGWLASPKL